MKKSNKDEQKDKMNSIPPLKKNESGGFTIESLNKKILVIKKIIRDKFPELSKFLDDKPLVKSKESIREVSIEKLSQYYLSLEEILNKYDQGHSDLQK